MVVRPLAGGASQQLAALTPEETQTQSAELAFVRGDLRTSSLGATAGFILADGFTASGWQKPYDVRCVYPVDVTPPGTTGAHGCDLLGGTTPVPPDWSSCATHGVTDATTWLAHFVANGQAPLRQCSLSAQTATQFHSAMQAHGQVADSLAQMPMSLLIPAWNPATPATIPVQAFYYDASTPGQLVQAQRYQMQYFTATNEWVPILRVTFAPGQGASFGFDETDQMDEGFRVAERLTDRYKDLSSSCNGGKDPAFYCDGVLIRMVAVRDMPVWNPRADYFDRDGVSFSYLRADAKVTSVASWTGGTGLIMKEFNAPSEQRLILKCSFPTDAGTASRPDSCIPPAGYGDPRFCDQLGVTSYATWYARYSNSNIWGHCPFRPDPASFQLSITIRRDYPSDVIMGYKHNEITMKPWPRDIPAKLPLEAFVAVGNVYADARTIQQGYFGATGRFLPIIRVNVTAAADQVFIYVPGDQIGAN
ncbi:hypothetical protein [Pandoraea aquatica]|uniref:hypothetical protein n=1 Tax=Pandoraea aquatica TaxID=2508290 RepID=UPI001242D704|nr:hypothetical protein [Pandoraea aquatica]